MSPRRFLERPLRPSWWVAVPALAAAAARAGATALHGGACTGADGGCLADKRFRLFDGRGRGSGLIAASRMPSCAAVCRRRGSPDSRPPRRLRRTRCQHAHRALLISMDVAPPHCVEQGLCLPKPGNQARITPLLVAARRPLLGTLSSGQVCSGARIHFSPWRARGAPSRSSSGRGIWRPLSTMSRLSRPDEPFLTARSNRARSGL